MPDQEFETASLCRRSGQTCGACCSGVAVQREELTALLVTQRTSFLRWTKNGTKLNALRLFLHETSCRRGAHLLWALLLRLPKVRQTLKKRMSQTLTCCFLGFDDDRHESVGCMLHPTRFGGKDVRRANAFRFLPGIECSDPNFTCGGCRQFDDLHPDQKSAVAYALKSRDWFDYSQTIRLISAGLIRLPKPSVTESESALLPILPE